MGPYNKNNKNNKRRKGGSRLAKPNRVLNRKRKSMSSRSPSPSPSPQQAKRKGKRIFSHIPSTASNSLRGTVYDLKHWEQLPPALNGEPPSTVYAYAITRDNRQMYLLYILCLVVFIVLLIVLVLKIGRWVNPPRPRAVYAVPQPAPVPWINKL